MFDLSKNYGENDFDLIPEGYYPVCVDLVEWKVSKSGAHYLEMRLSITGDKFANRKVFHRLNLLHEKEIVRNYAMADLKRFIIASGFDVSALTSLSQDKLGELLLSCIAVAKITIEKSKDPNYPDKNVIKGWKAVDKRPARKSEGCPF